MPSTKSPTAKKRSKEVDAYIAKLPDDRRESFTKLRALIHKAAPKIRESMFYRMPTFETDGLICSMAAQKSYLSFYMCRTELVKKHAAELKHLNCGKCCIRFKRFSDLPAETITAMVKEAVKLGPE